MQVLFGLFWLHKNFTTPVYISFGCTIKGKQRTSQEFQTEVSAVSPCIKYQNLRWVSPYNHIKVALISFYSVLTHIVITETALRKVRIVQWKIIANPL